MTGAALASRSWGNDARSAYRVRPTLEGRSALSQRPQPADAALPGDVRNGQHGDRLVGLTVDDLARPGDARLTGRLAANLGACPEVVPIGRRGHGRGPPVSAGAPYVVGVLDGNGCAPPCQATLSAMASAATVMPSTVATPSTRHSRAQSGQSARSDEPWVGTYGAAGGM
jgi:hypothetical protein